MDEFELLNQLMETIGEIEMRDSRKWNSAELRAKRVQICRELVKINPTKYKLELDAAEADWWRPPNWDEVDKKFKKNT